MAQRKEEASKYFPSLTTVLEESGLRPVTDANTLFNMISFGNREPDEVLKFKGKATSKDNTIPLEALIIIDSKEYETIRIYLSEGYSFEPSDQLTQLYKKLDQALEPINGHKTSSMW